MEFQQEPTGVAEAGQFPVQCRDEVPSSAHRYSAGHDCNRSRASRVSSSCRRTRI